MSTAKGHSLARRRRILLAMDLWGENIDRHMGIARYAREAGWILDARLMPFVDLGHHNEYMASIKFDGIISRMKTATPELREIVVAAKVPVVDLWQDWPELNVPRVL